MADLDELDRPEPQRHFKLTISHDIVNLFSAEPTVQGAKTEQEVARVLSKLPYLAAGYKIVIFASPSAAVERILMSVPEDYVSSYYGPASPVPVAFVARQSKSLRFFECLIGNPMDVLPHLRGEEGVKFPVEAFEDVQAVVDTRKQTKIDLRIDGAQVKYIDWIGAQGISALLIDDRDPAFNARAAASIARSPEPIHVAGKSIRALSDLRRMDYGAIGTFMSAGRDVDRADALDPRGDAARAFVQGAREAQDGVLDRIVLCLIGEGNVVSELSEFPRTRQVPTVSLGPASYVFPAHR